MATGTIKKSLFTTAVLNLPESCTVPSNGFFSLQFNPALSGYIPIAIISYNLADRALGGNIFITGFYVAENVAIIYGKGNPGTVISTNATATILYKSS